SAGTSEAETRAGLIAATCMAMSLATASSPAFIATSAPMRVPWRYAPTTAGASTTSKRRTPMFSPIFAISARRASSTEEPSSKLNARSASSVAGRWASASFATFAAKFLKSCSRATKSVSQLTSTIAARLPSPERSMTITPSAATRAAFLSAFARPALRMSSAAASRSPLVSTSAFLHSIMPAPVRSRSNFTASAVTAIESLRGCVDVGCGLALGDRGTTAGHELFRRHVPLDVVHFRGNDVFDALDVFRFLRGATASRRLLLHGRGAAATRGRCAGLRLRLALLVQLDELILAGGHFRNRGTAFDHGIRNAFGVQLDRTHGVVVAGNQIVDIIRRAVRIDDGDDGNAELLRLVDRDALVTDVDDEQHIGQRLHFLDA